MRSILSLVMVGLVTTSCTSTTAVAPPTGPELSHAAKAAGSAGQPVPISGGCDLSFTVLSASPPIIEQQDVGRCQISHLGRTSFVGVQHINVVTGTQSGQRTLTAANGDVLHAVHTGTSSPAGAGLVSFQATLTFTGGTGRFAGATGEAKAEGVANPVERTATMQLEGVIVYQASSRAP